jgi:hypothetical protein
VISSEKTTHRILKIILPGKYAKTDSSQNLGTQSLDADSAPIAAAMSGSVQNESWSRTGESEDFAFDVRDFGTGQKPIPAQCGDFQGLRCELRI